MFALQVRELDSPARQDSFYGEGAFMRLATGHHLGAKRYLRPHRGTADDRTAFSDPPQAPKRAFKHVNESVFACGPRTAHQSFAAQ
jgi:hypothetical protein